MADTDTTLITFKAISNFINELSEVFAEQHKPLKLYSHLINKTTLSHEMAINKHQEAFQKFCQINREAIDNRNHKNLIENLISYSDKVYVDMEIIFALADKETQGIIWKHILTIAAIVDPESKAKLFLRAQNPSNKSANGNETDFLQDIISKIEENVDDNTSNPMEAVSSIMQSGVFTDLIKGMGNGLQDGSLDLGKLMGTVQNMVGNINEQHNQNPDSGADEAVNMINNMMGTLGNMTSNSENSMDDLSDQGMPNIAAMMGPMLGAMMNMPQQDPINSGCLNNPYTSTPTIEEVEEDEETN